MHSGLVHVNMHQGIVTMDTSDMTHRADFSSALVQNFCVSGSGSEPSCYCAFIQGYNYVAAQILHSNVDDSPYIALSGGNQRDGLLHF
jgi:hypothetical protein